MKLQEFRRYLPHCLWPMIIASSVFLAACGGGSGGGGGPTQTAGIGGTGIVAGKITAFGSIFVNGREIETDQSQFIVDGVSFPNQAAANLQLGMYVLLEVKTLNGNFTDEALNVIYDDEVQGPVAGLPALVGGETQRTFTVFGQTVTIDDTSTLFQGAPGNPGFGFDTISNSDVVEISGFRTSANTISASYIEWKETLVVGSEVELRGTISGYNPPIEQFLLDTFRVDFDSMVTEIETPNGMLSNGMYVEVKGTYQTGPVRIVADKIEFEDEDLGDEVDDVSLQGVISNWFDIGNFEIDDQPIDASGVSLSPAIIASLDNGVEVEVEGDIEGGILNADELELREADSELRTTVRTVDLPGNRFELEFPGNNDDSLGTVWINVDGQTLFEDESAANLPNFSLDLLMVGNFVRVKGIANLSGINPEVDAETVKRRDPDSTRLEGVVQAKVKPDSITILGITYPVDLAATYEDENGTPMNANDFFDAIVVDTSVVELEDDDPADGDADKLEFDD